MSANGLEVFDRTLQITHIWLDEIIEALHTDRQTAWRVLGAVLRALRDRLPPGLSAHLSAELPLLVRGAYFEHWRPGEETLKLRSLAEFLERVSAGLAHGKPIGSLDATRALFAVLDPPSGSRDRSRRCTMRCRPIFASSGRSAKLPSR